MMATVVTGLGLSACGGISPSAVSRLPGRCDHRAHRHGSSHRSRPVRRPWPGRGHRDAGRTVPDPRPRAAARPVLHPRSHRPGGHPVEHRLDMTVSPVSVQICVICALRLWLPGVRRCCDDASQRRHARAEGWPDQHLREVPVIGCRSWQYRTLGPAV